MKARPKGDRGYSRGERSDFLPPENLTPSQWAEKYRRLPRGQSNLSDRYKNALSPYSTAIMDLCAIPGLAQLVVIKAAQIGASEALRNVVGWAAHLVPDPAGIAMPDEKKGRAIVDNRILPLFRGTPPLKKLMTPRSADATKQQIKLQNGFILHLMWSGSASSMASDPMRIGICDEVDKFSPWTHGQGEPVSLVQARLRTYGERGLLIAASTPSTRYGRIWQLFDDCSIKVYFFVPCPRCGFRQRLLFSNLKFDKGDKPDRHDQADHIRRNASAWYECAGCHGKIVEADKPSMCCAGKYQTEYGEGVILDIAGRVHESIETVEAFAPGTSVGVHISGLYCLWLSWAEVAAQFVLAQGSREKMFAFKTDTLGEPFDEQTTKLHADTFTLKASRAKLPEGIIPKWGVALDVRHDRVRRLDVPAVLGAVVVRVGVQRVAERLGHALGGLRRHVGTDHRRHVALRRVVHHDLPRLHPHVLLHRRLLSVTRCIPTPYMTHQGMRSTGNQVENAEFRMTHVALPFALWKPARRKVPPASQVKACGVFWNSSQRKGSR